MPTFLFTAGRAEKIKANLRHMQQAARKKKEAQEHYYGQGKSPLRKQNKFNNKQVQQQPKLPKRNVGSVQQRLGANNKASFTSNRNNTKKQFVPRNKQDKINRVQNYNFKRFQNNIMHNNQQFNQNRNKSGAIRTVNPQTGEVKYLWPMGKQYNAKPQNLTVSVRNGKNNMDVHAPKHANCELNPMIQEEIRHIQNVKQFSSMTPDILVPIMNTKTTLHERFSRM